MDFVTDSVVTGGRLCAPAIVDDCSRECPVIEVDTVASGDHKVISVLERLAETRGLPEVITMDNRPEFPGRDLDEWAHHKAVKLNFIRPGKPIENALAESFVGRLRDECLNTNWFMNLKHPRDIIEDWRRDYNDVRPLSLLKGSTPKEYAEAASGVQSRVLVIAGVRSKWLRSLVRTLWRLMLTSRGRRNIGVPVSLRRFELPASRREQRYSG